MSQLAVDLDLWADRLDAGEDPKTIAAEMRRAAEAENDYQSGDDL